MRIFSWRWILALVQITAAVAAFVYAPYQYRAGRHAIGDDSGLRIWRQTWPPPVLRMSYAINFPAVAVAYSVQFASWSSWTVFRREPFIRLSVQDSMFLLGVGALWYWLGTALDRLLGHRSNARRSKPLTMLGLATGCLFAVGVAALATFYTMATDADRPYRQIGLFGLIWAVVLLCHFVWSLVVVLKTPALDSPHYPL